MRIDLLRLMQPVRKTRRIAAQAAELRAFAQSQVDPVLRGDQFDLLVNELAEDLVNAGMEMSAQELTTLSGAK